MRPLQVPRLSLTHQVPIGFFGRWQARAAFGACSLVMLFSMGCRTASVYPRIGVPDFESTLSGEADERLKGTMAELLTSTLVNDARIIMIERRDIELLQRRGARGKNELLLGKIASKLKADYLILGSISRLEGNYILNVRLFSARTGASVSGSSETRYCRREEDLFPSLQAMAAFVAQKASEDYAARTL